MNYFSETDWQDFSLELYSPVQIAVGMRNKMKMYAKKNHCFSACWSQVTPMQKLQILALNVGAEARIKDSRLVTNCTAAH